MQKNAIWIVWSVASTLGLSWGPVWMQTKNWTLICLGPEANSLACVVFNGGCQFLGINLLQTVVGAHVLAAAKHMAQGASSPNVVIGWFDLRGGNVHTVSHGKKPLAHCSREDK